MRRHGGDGLAGERDLGDARIGGEWKTVYSDDLNILRFRKVSFAPVDADALRLVVTESWGGGKSHVFAFDARH